MNRRTLVTCILLLVTAFGCVDPQKDYDDFLDRTEGKRGPQPKPDTGSSLEDVAPEGGEDGGLPSVTGTFVVSCLPTLAGGDASKSLLFYGEATMVQAAGSAKLDIKLTPLLETATSLSKSETVGASFGATAMPVSMPDGRWTANTGELAIPGNSQRIGDSNLKFIDTVFHGRILSADRMCMELDGKLVEPFEVDFSGPGDFCVWVRHADGTPLPTAMAGGVTYTGFDNKTHECGPI